MKSFTYPHSRAWLPKSAFKTLVAECERTWHRIQDVEPTQFDNAEFGELQNHGMLLKFFLEQAFGNGAPTGRGKILLERDAGGIDGFRSTFLAIAKEDSVEWIVWGLSFASFRFHLFPASASRNLMPFCVSPMLVGCLRGDVVIASGLDRVELAERQVAAINWEVVENRIGCLEKPLDVLEQPADCQDPSLAATSG